MQQNKKPASSPQEGLFLADFLQQLLFEDFTGKVDVVTAQEIGYVYLQSGEPIHAELSKQEGDEALISLLTFSETTLTAIPSVPSPKHSIQNKLEDLLLESALRMEKSSQAGTRLISTKSHKIIEKTKCFLEIEIPGKSKTEFPLENKEVSIGRSSQNTIEVTNPSLSNHHALIYIKAGGYFIKDLNSSNGTFVNGRPIINEIELKNGDLMTLGEIQIKFLSRLKRPQIQTSIKTPVTPKRSPQKAAFRISQALREHSSKSKKTLPFSSFNILIAVVVLILLSALYFLFVKR